MADQQKVQYLIEVLKQGNGAVVAANELQNLERQAQQTDQKMAQTGQRLRNALAGIGAALIVREILAASEAADGFQNTLRNIKGSSEAAAQDLRFVGQEALRLGLSLQNTTKDFISISAAAKGTRLEGEATRQIFLGIAEAGTVLKLSAETMSGTLQAVQQMISKGTVAAEEMRGQLGERLPGAFQIAARSMNLTTAEFAKLLDSGKIVAEEFLPRFAAELRKTFSKDAEASARSLGAEMNRFKTALFELEVAAGKQGVTSLVRDIVVFGTQSANLLAKNETALIALANAVKLASAALVAFGAQMVLMRAWTATVGLFGAAWLKSAADVQAASALMATSTVSATTAMTAGVAGVTAAVMTLIEGLRMVNALSEQIKAEAKVFEVNDNLRKTLEERIAAEESSGNLSPKAADEIRSKIVQGFRKDAVTRRVYSNVGGLGTFQPMDVTSEERNPDRELQTLRDISRQYFGTKGTDAAKVEAAAKLTDEQKKALEELRRLQNQMTVDALSGFDQQMAKAGQAYEERERQILALAEASKISESERAALIEQNEAVLFHEVEAINAKKREQRDRDAAEEAEQIRARIELERRAAQEVQSLKDELQLSFMEGFERERLAAEINYRRRKEFIAEMPELEEETAIELEAMNQAAYNAEVERIENLKRLKAEEAELEKGHRRQILQMGIQSAQLFAQGMSGALVDFISNTKSAGEAFREFAANFLRQVAQMILQYLLLLAIQRALSGIFGASSSVVTTFSNATGLPPVTGAAEGGMFAPVLGHVAAIQGARKMANGGMEMLGGPRYYPQYNVLAGEAGRELAAFLARPTVGQIGGMPAIFGEMEHRRMALINADIFGKARPMANGGMAGALPSAPAPAAPSPGGKAVVEIQLKDGLEAKIVSNSVEAAEVRITQQLQQDSAISAATRRLVQ